MRQQNRESDKIDEKNTEKDSLNALCNYAADNPITKSFGSGGDDQASPSICVKCFIRWQDTKLPR